MKYLATAIDEYKGEFIEREMYDAHKHVTDGGMTPAVLEKTYVSGLLVYISDAGQDGIDAARCYIDMQCDEDYRHELLLHCAEALGEVI
jgi:hypothetical protein